MGPGCNLLANWNQNWVFKESLPTVVNILNFYSNTLTSNRTPNYCNIFLKACIVDSAKFRHLLQIQKFLSFFKKGCPPPISLGRAAGASGVLWMGFHVYWVHSSLTRLFPHGTIITTLPVGPKTKWPLKYKGIHSESF
jgi:hypothetical protein